MSFYMLRIELRSSRYIAAVLTTVHVSAIATISSVDAPITAKVALGILILTSLAQSVWRHALLRARGALIALELGDKGEVVAQTRDGQWHDARILGTSYVSPTLTTINVRLAGRTMPLHLLLVPDNCDADAFRRLRVLLRWGYRRR